MVLEPDEENLTPLGGRETAGMAPIRGPKGRTNAERIAKAREMLDLIEAGRLPDGNPLPKGFVISTVMVSIVAGSKGVGTFALTGGVCAIADTPYVLDAIIANHHKLEDMEDAT